MRSDDAVAVARDMGSRTFDERAKEPCIGEDRAQLLVAGCAITDVVCDIWPSKMIRVADRGLREGMLIGLMKKRQRAQPNPRNKTPVSKAKVVPDQMPKQDIDPIAGDQHGA